MGTAATKVDNWNGTEVASDEAVAAAEEAGLQYVSDEKPGYRRRLNGKDFKYLDTEGKRIRDEQRVLRIKRLAIPPAWTDVWICPSPTGHIQATGRDARENKSFGLTTIKDRHVTLKGAHLRFRFRGKSGRQHEVDIRDRQVAKVISRLQDLPGQELFQYIDDDGKVHDVRSQDVNDYLRGITDENFTAKDFRTWAGTLLSALALNAQGGFKTNKEGKANVKTAISAVAQLLGNTPAICRKCYVHPAIIEAYLSGTQIAGLGQAIKNSAKINLHAVERAVLKSLRATVRD